MVSLQKAAAAAIVIVAALTLQGCKKKPAQQPPQQPHYAPPPHHAPPPAHEPHPVVARVAVDGHPCEHTWRATWRDGAHSVCRTFCCYHRNRKTHRRTLHSYCRVHEQGHEVLKMCAPRGAVLPFSAAEMMEEEPEEPLELSAPELDGNADMIEEEVEEAEEGTSAAERFGALPLFACSAGFVLGGVSVFMALRPRLRRATGNEEQKEPFIES
mmetsp:Transcript_38195/g.95834  ORF Transcript_38195/g.95834 Transcript_38195/m.95834 type:complete len:213 (-) Transcript_38195:174-812(-)